MKNKTDKNLRLLEICYKTLFWPLDQEKLDELELLSQDKEIDINFVRQDQNFRFASKSKENALMIASRGCDPRAIMTILKNPEVNLDLQNQDGETALIIAGQNANYYGRERYSESRFEIVKLLLDKGANPNICNNLGRNFLMNLSANYDFISLPYKKTQEAEKLGLIAGEQIRNEYIDKISGKVSTSFYFKPDEAEKEKYKEKIRQKIIQTEEKSIKEIISYLIQNQTEGNQIDVNKIDLQEKSALILANENKNMALVEELIKIGANPYHLKRNLDQYKYLTNQEDYRNISCPYLGNKFSEMINAITQSVRNRKISEYPWAKLNQDNSVSFFIASQETANITDFNQDFRQKIKEDYVLEQFKFQICELGLKTIENKEFLEIKTHPDSTEYCFNLSPQNLDSILKLNPKYNGYRNSGNLLELNRQFTLKEGMIRLFPVFQLNEKEFLIRASGCQLVEMPNLQLMHLLPNYQTEILPKHNKDDFYFHWSPKEVEESLLLEKNIIEILNNIFTENGIDIISDGRKTKFNLIENDFLQIQEESRNCSIVIAPIDQPSKDFYAMYGNVSEEELSFCLSLEVKTESLLKEIDNYLIKKDDDNQKVINARAIIAKMVENLTEISHPKTDVSAANAEKLHQQKTIVI